MAKQSVSFLVPSEKVSKLDAVAANQERDRSYVLNEAVDLYLDHHKYYTELVEQGIADIEAGRTMTQEQVIEAVNAQRKRDGRGLLPR